MLRARLREETRALHERVEQRLDLSRPGRPLEWYRTVLKAFHGFYTPTEFVCPAYGADAARWIDTVDRRKSHLLRADLQHLGLTPGEVHQLPNCREMTAPMTPSRQLGCMYVMEGSTLGGQYIVRHLDRSWPSAFFRSYGASVGSAWKSFCAVLDLASADAEPVNCDEVVAGASETFKRLDRWFGERGL